MRSCVPEWAGGAAKPEGMGSAIAMHDKKNLDNPRCCHGGKPRAALGLRRFLGRARRNTDGVAAIEFALVALPLFMLIMGTIEVGLFFAAGLVLEGSVAEAARTVRTGQAQQSDDPEATFRQALCDFSRTMLDCSRMQYEVIHIGNDSFQTAESAQPQFDDDGNLIPQGFDAGNSNDIILIRTVYRYEFLTPFIGSLMTGDPSRNWMNHMATVVIKAEPYVFGEN